MGGGGPDNMGRYGSVRGACEEWHGNVSGACWRRHGRHGTFQGRFRSVTGAREEMVESFGSVREASKSDMKR